MLKWFKSLLDEEVEKKVGIATHSKERKNKEHSGNMIAPCKIGRVHGGFYWRTLENFPESTEHINRGNHHTPDCQNTSDLQGA
jgi:hypothetical protein